MKTTLQMNKSLTSLLLFCALALGATELQAQNKIKQTQYGAVGVSIGAMNYFGDITPQPNFVSFRLGSTRPTVGVNYTYKFAPRLAVKGALNWGRLIGEDALSASSNEGENFGRYKRNLSFRNDIKELSAVAVIDLFENSDVFQKRQDFVPYAFLGVALFHHNPKAYYQNGSRLGLSKADDIPTGWYDLQPLGTEGQHLSNGAYPSPYKRVQVAIPFGLGMRYKIDQNFDLSFEVSWRKTFTDYLDDASGTYVNKSGFLKGPSSIRSKAAAILSDRSEEAFPGLAVSDPSGTPYKIVPGYGTFKDKNRGDTSRKDWYISTNFNLSYIIPSTIKSPKVR